MNIPEQIKTLNCDFTQSNLFSKNLQEFKDIFDNDIQDDCGISEPIQTNIYQFKQKGRNASD